MHVVRADAIPNSFCTSNSLNDLEVGLDDIDAGPASAPFSEGDAVECQSGSDVQNLLSTHEIAVEQAVPAADLEWIVLGASQLPNMAQLVNRQVEELRALYPFAMNV